MNTDVAKCKSITVSGSLIYCAQCRRIIGYVDERNIAHLQNVRLLRYEPLSVNINGGKRVQFMSVSENNKRKYSVDMFDLMEEPSAKRRRIEQDLTVMRLGVDYDVNDIEPNQNRLWEDAEFSTHTPGPLTPPWLQPILNDSLDSYQDSSEDSIIHHVITDSEDGSIIDLDLYPDSPWWLSPSDDIISIGSSESCTSFEYELESSDGLTDNAFVLGL